jgi:plastocyanin domain-containing protein
MTRVMLLLALVAACKKDDKPEGKDVKDVKVAPVTAGTVTDGVRRIEVEAGKEGYVPDKIPGKPGEKLMLVFTRTVNSDCLAQLKTPEGKLVDLPMGKSVEVAVTVPASGQLGFACGMDMFHGVIVAQPAT